MSFNSASQSKQDDWHKENNNFDQNDQQEPFLIKCFNGYKQLVENP